MSNQEALKRRKRWLEEMQGRYATGEEDSRLASLLSSSVVARASNSSSRGRDKRSLFSYLGRHFTAVSCLVGVIHDKSVCIRNMTW